MVDEATKYKIMLGKGLSIRAMARILKIAPSTAAYRLKKLQLTGSLQHRNKGKANRPARHDKDLILELATTVYKDFGIAHICELLLLRHNITIPKETLRRWLKRPYKYHRKKNETGGSVLLILVIYFKLMVLLTIGLAMKNSVL